jgi:hypothetical protein
MRSQAFERPAGGLIKIHMTLALKTSKMEFSNDKL